MVISSEAVGGRAEEAAVRQREARRETVNL